MAAPPNLQAWTNRAETYDNLKNSVSKTSDNLNKFFFREAEDINSDAIVVTGLFFSLIFFSLLFIEHADMAGEDCNGWEICWPSRLVSFCCEGVIPTLTLGLTERRSNITYRAFRIMTKVCTLICHLPIRKNFIKGC